MSKFILFGFLFTFIVNISADSYSSDNIQGKICGTHPWTFRCPGKIIYSFNKSLFFLFFFNYLANTQCGTYANRLCYTESKGPTIGGIIVFTVIGLFIFIMILHACIKCCSPSSSYHSLSSTDHANLSRNGAVVCTVAAHHF